jgi:ribosomal protein L19
MNYFNCLFFNINQKKEWINLRKNYKYINKNTKYFNRGDIITITFWHKSYNYYFEGLCLGLKKKSFNAPNITIILRNVLQNTIIEFIGPYYLNRFFLKTFISNYKRKKLWYKSSKLFYLREKENKASKIKN